MTEAEFSTYKKEIEKQFGSCRVLTANQDTIFFCLTNEEERYR